ncbi:MAG: biotin--[acetyl-CoA-carboxylase] ligase [Duncaniella sp.]|nr:biotin--[acetyl-CoA-carboxylase] ligase [Duncaniella sp.]
MTTAPVITLPTVGSTNTWMTTEGADLPHGAVVRAVAQTAGRGQRGNSWEAEPGQNLTFSMMLRPEGIDAAAQFAVSEAVALGVADVLARHIPGEEITVKWPNDIYAGDRKICGILIENTLAGREIVRSVAGIGVNVNQRIFRSDAPNPVSMWQLTGGETPLEPLLAEIQESILRLMEAPLGLNDRYCATLWRRSGMHPYIDHTRGSIPMTARILSVAPTGHITLLDDTSTPRTYAIKEITFVI